MSQKETKETVREKMEENMLKRRTEKVKRGKHTTGRINLKQQNTREGITKIKGKRDKKKNNEYNKESCIRNTLIVNIIKWQVKFNPVA